MNSVTIQPPLTDPVYTSNNAQDSNGCSHAVMILLGDVHEHAHIVAALGKAKSHLIPKLLGVNPSSTESVCTWLGDPCRRSELLREACARLQVRLHENQADHILSINNTLTVMNTSASGTIRPTQEKPFTQAKGPEKESYPSTIPGRASADNNCNTSTAVSHPFGAR
jgi:hypothetical protein